MRTPKINAQFQNAMRRTSDNAEAMMAITDHPPVSPGIPHTARPRRVKATTVAVIRTKATGRLAESGTSRESSRENSDTSATK